MTFNDDNARGTGSTIPNFSIVMDGIPNIVYYQHYVSFYAMFCGNINKLMIIQYFYRYPIFGENQAKKKTLAGKFTN